MASAVSRFLPTISKDLQKCNPTVTGETIAASILINQIDDYLEKGWISRPKDHFFFLGLPEPRDYLLTYQVLLQDGGYLDYDVDRSLFRIERYTTAKIRVTPFAIEMIDKAVSQDPEIYFYPRLAALLDSKYPPDISTPILISDCIVLASLRLIRKRGNIKQLEEIIGLPYAWLRHSSIRLRAKGLLEENFLRPKEIVKRHMIA